MIWNIINGSFTEQFNYREFIQSVPLLKSYVRYYCSGTKTFRSGTFKGTFEKGYASEATQGRPRGHPKEANCHLSTLILKTGKPEAGTLHETFDLLYAGGYVLTRGIQNVFAKTILRTALLFLFAFERSKWIYHNVCVRDLNMIFD